MIFKQPEHSICIKKYSYHSWNNTGVNLQPWIRSLRQTARFQSPRKNRKLPQNINMFFQPMSDIYTLIMWLLADSWFEIMEFNQILLIPAFWHWKIGKMLDSISDCVKKTFLYFTASLILICISIRIIYFVAINTSQSDLNESLKCI